MSLYKNDGPIRRGDLPDRLRARLRRKEKDMQRSCRSLWTFTNPKDERIMFGKFTAGRDDVTVTVSHYQPNVGWV